MADTLQASREALVKLMHECREQPRQPEYKDLLALLDVMLPAPASPPAPVQPRDHLAGGMRDD